MSDTTSLDAVSEPSEGAGEIDFAGLPDLAPQEQPEQSQEQEQGGGNPAWGTILEKVPAPFHNVIRPELENWDRGVQQRLEAVRQEVRQQYEPFQQFLDNQVDPQELHTAYNLMQQLTANPQRFYEVLRDSLGFSEEEAADAVEELQEQQEQEDPRIAQLMQQQQQMLEYFQQQQMEQQRQAQMQQMNQQIDDEFAAIERKHGKLSDEVKGRVLEQALLMNQRTQSVVSIEDAFNELTKFVAKVRSAPGPGDTAPPAMPTSGGLPSQPSTGNKSIGQLSPAERRALAAQVIQQTLPR